MVPGQVEESRALQRRVAATAKRFLQARRHLRGCEVRVSRGHHERRAGQNAQELGQALTGLEHGETARCYMHQAWQSIPRLVTSGSNSAAVMQLRTVCTST